MTSPVHDQTARSKPFALFISDLHLQEEMPETAAAFLAFLKHPARAARQLYLLGDIFEYWAGDDDLAAPSPFNQKIVQALRAVSDAGVKLFWMAGNRDFLVGDDFARATGATRLHDPTCLEFAGQRYLLAHGDQLCTDDVKYQEFRTMVRAPAWQASFLAQSLEQRKKIIATMRAQSKQHQMNQSAMIMDVNQDAVSQLVNTHQAQILIHGHTHRPAEHHSHGTVRFVLSDWDQDNAPQRGDWLALLDDGSLQRHDASSINTGSN
jgi:UDP-2,3-diacylglucosamine hydrolase